MTENEGGEDPKAVNLKMGKISMSFAFFSKSGHLVDALIFTYLPIFPKCKRLLGSISLLNGGRYRRSSLLAPLSKEANQQLGDNLHRCRVMTNQATRSKNLHKTDETAMALANLSQKSCGFVHEQDAARLIISSIQILKRNSSNRTRRINSCHSSPSHPLVHITRNCHAHFLKRKYTSPVQTFLTVQCF